jgi:hypothetical protein
MDYAVYACRQPGCGGPRSGTCINRLKFEDCPDVIPIVEAGEVRAEPLLEPAKDNLVITGNQSSLDAVGCDTLLRERGGQLVGIVAGPEAGKTTLIATLYELVRKRRLAGVKFAGSETLRGYEERCYLARVASNEPQPDTPRTRRADDLSFTHLRLVNDNRLRDLIFSDRSGEYFDAVLDRPASMAGLVELQRADVVLLLVDLQRYGHDPHASASEVRRLFLALDQHVPLRRNEVVLVGTKSDLLAPEVVASFLTKLENLAAELSARSTQNATLRFLATACRRRRGATQGVEGVAELLQYVLEANDPQEQVVAAAWPVPATELDRLMISYRGKKQS